MAVTDWTPWSGMLDELSKQRADWQDATTYDEFQKAISDKRPELWGGEGSFYGDRGLRNLLDSLRAEISDDNTIYEQIRESTLTEPAAEEQGGLVADQATGLLYDDANWYLKDGKTIVTQVGDTDVFTDAAQTRYRMGEPFQWYDPDTRLLYDDANWYLKDGRTIVTQVGDTDVYVDAAQTRYRMGEPIGPEQADDEEYPEVTEAIGVMMADNLREAINEIRALGLTEDDLTDDEISLLFDDELEEILLQEIES